MGCKSLSLLQSSANLDRKLMQVGAHSNIQVQARAKVEYVEDQSISKIIKKISSMEL